MRDLVCAVDVGTGSARAGLFDRSGNIVARAEHEIALNQPEAAHAEHDSEDIWRAVCQAVRKTLELSARNPASVAALAFDATCSLVVRGAKGQQVSVSRNGESRWDTIAWFDHRAAGEADECTATGHRVLDYIGKVMSPEMQTPKLMWLKRNLPESWATARYFFDLSDYLSWKACGSLERSLCTLTAKWTYLAHDSGWQHDFFAKVGLQDMLASGSLTDRGSKPGTSLGSLTEEAANDLGLDKQCVVAVGLIDAFAGAVGLIGGIAQPELENHFALIAGTSTCLTGMSSKENPLRGTWGPYYGAALPDLWLWEAGQSATGALLDHVIRVFGQGLEPSDETREKIVGRIRYLRDEGGPEFASDLHVLPDFLGNRSPLSDPHARGVINGLALDSSFDGLCRIYWRTAVAIAFGVRHILDHLHDNGVVTKAIHVAGGHRKNPLLMELYPDVLECRVCEPQCADAVLLGTAMVAATAAGWYPDLPEACTCMKIESLTLKRSVERANSYERDYSIFRKLIEQQRELRRLT
jgi:FGGY-family pentulose kinase